MHLEHYWGGFSQASFKTHGFSGWFSTFLVGKARERSGFSLYSPITVPDLLGEQKSRLYDVFSSCFSAWKIGIQTSGYSREEPRAGAESWTSNAWTRLWLRAMHSVIQHHVPYCQPSLRNGRGLLLIRGWDWTRNQRNVGQHHRGLTALKR